MKSLICIVVLTSIVGACGEQDSGPERPDFVVPEAPKYAPPASEPTDGCGSAAIRADLAPTATDLMLVVDRSGATLRKTQPDGPVEWDVLRSKIDAFAKSMDRPDVRVGLTVFPQGAAAITCCKIDPVTNA